MGLENIAASMAAAMTSENKRDALSIGVCPYLCPCRGVAQAPSAAPLTVRRPCRRYAGDSLSTLANLRHDAASGKTLGESTIAKAPREFRSLAPHAGVALADL